VSFEINPAGSTGSFGIPTAVQVGLPTDATMNADWTSSNVARYTPEAAVARFKRVMPDTLFPKSLLVGQAYLYAGYANRLLGENFCQSVIPIVVPDTTAYVLSPGSLGSHTLYFLRADTAFTNAITTFTASGDTTAQTANFILAARGGRASVRADLATYGLASWADAVADAVPVPNTFVFQAPYSSASPDQYNYLYWARANQSFRAHTQWGTFYEGYYRTTRDPRVKWDSTGLKGDAAVAKFGGRVPFWPEAKYTTTSAPVRLSSGWEMRLIEAEAALVAGDTAAARASMNVRRTALALPGVTFTTLPEAWTALKTERAIELWLEARRLGDLRRWTDNSVPGGYVDGTYRASVSDTLHATPIETMTAPVLRAHCFPVGRNERETNPNVP
ncbi:MAG TPA: RagB/SusD family nutrient uptake outer membrane protein, partial [Gemmatimonadales bacterium]|nr:RagB/SusD family nutrient uptake outer membrane protein [Gemmatimonadales bacterium]